jgi:hypothetical protein
MLFEVMKNIINIEKNIIPKRLSPKLKPSKKIEPKSPKPIKLESDADFIKNEWPWLI